MSKHLSRIFAILLTLSLLLGVFPAALAAPVDPGSTAAEAVQAETDVPAEPPLTGFHHVDLPGYHRPAEEKTNANRDPLPASFNAVTQGWVTDVKSQQPYGTCWAFGTLSPIESYMIKHQIPVGSTGKAATTDLDLSEWHLSYFSYTNAYDELGLTEGDSSILADSHLSIGGDGYKSTMTLMRWEGPASESIPELAYNQADPDKAINPKYAYDYDVAHISDVDWINTSDRNAVKQAIMEYGSGFFGYCWMQAYNSTNRSGAYCYIQSNYTYGANHAVTLVGWDDNYSKENFNYLPANSRPQNDGAWIVKNSWGAGGTYAAYTDNGYNYISYEDTASSLETCMFFKAEPVDKYQHIYQYDGTLNIDDYVGLMSNHSKVANVFTAQGHEKVEAVSILTLEEGLGYTLELYKNLTNATDPTSGTLVGTQTGTIAYNGYHTIPLETPVSVQDGETFSAVFTLHSNQPTDTLMMVVPVDASRTDNYETTTLTHTHTVHMNTSFFQVAGTGEWAQPKEGAGNFRIKAYTSDDPFALTAVSADPSKGSVSVGAHGSRGWVVTASPVNGYYASGCTVTSGNAVVQQEGNTFYVEPTEDSEIKISFAPKTAVTVTYKANGEIVGTVSGVTGEALTLPETAPVFENCSFLGWTPTQVASVPEQPQTYAPGASYYPLGNDTLYALYFFNHQAVEGEDGSYVKITDADELVDGKYLIVNEERQLALNGALIDSAIDVLDNEIEVTVNGNRIPEDETVNDSVFTYDSEYKTLAGKRETSSGKVYYIGAPGSTSTGKKYIYTTPYQTYAGLQFDFNSDGSVKITDSYYTAWSLKYYDNGSEANFRFTKKEDDVYPVSLFRKTEDTTQAFYTTDVDAEPMVSYVIHFNSNGGSHVVDQNVAAGQTVTRPDDPTRDGFSFAGWFTDVGLTQAYDFATPVTGSFTLYAKWTENAPVTHTVSFNSNGGSAVPAQTVPSGSTVTKPDDPTRDGFSFVGWYTDAGLTQAYDFATPVTGSFTLYAKWTEQAPQTYTVKFVSNGGSEVPDQTVIAGQTVTRPTDPTRDGFSFAGWFTDTALTKDYDFSAPVQSNFSLYAKWTENSAPHTHVPGTAVKENDRAPSCTTAGSYDMVVYCTVCGQELSRETTTVDALGHAWDEGVVTAEPKYLTPGEKKFTCSRCNETRTEEIARLDNPFEDVSEEDFFFNPVLWALDETVTGGVDETHFAPERTVMRADAMVFFWAANKRPAFTSTDKTFKDVKKKHWAYNAVMWAVENGITGGTDAAGNYFSPQRTCTRSEILQFLYAAMGKPEYTIENPYSDVKTKHWYYDGAIWAYEFGLEKGEDGKFNAKTPCTRGYVVTYLYRFLTGQELAE